MSVVSLTDFTPNPRYDDQAWLAARIEGQLPDGTWETLESFNLDPDTNPAEPVSRNFTTTNGDPSYIYLRVVWIDNEGNQDYTDPVATGESSLATVGDVENRLGRDLTERESTQFAFLLRAASSSIYTSLDQDETWTVPTNVRQLLRELCIEVAIRAQSNPAALGQESETLGAYSHTHTFAREIPGSGLLLTNIEEQLIRRAVYGQNAGTARVWQRDLYQYGQEAALLEPVRIIE